MCMCLCCLQFNRGATIVDSGTTDIYFPQTVFNKIKDTFIDHFRVSVIRDCGIPDYLYPYSLKCYSPDSIDVSCILACTCIYSLL